MTARVVFYPSRVAGTVPKGITVLEASRKLGIAIEGPCAGTGKCAKDMVQVRTNRIFDTVLACKTVIEDDIEVVVPTRERDTKVVEGFFLSGEQKVDPLVTKRTVLSGYSLSTNVYVDGRLLNVEAGDTAGLLYGAAVDIGTTTVVTSLVDLKSGRTVGSSSLLNPLVYYGHDVMSRIRYSGAQTGGLKRMHGELVSAINLMIGVLCSENGIERGNVYHLTAAGNTTMQHIFLNKEIKSIGEYPYKAEVLGTYTAKAEGLGVKIAPYAPVVTFPCISAYVGGDIVSGLMAVNPDKMELPAIFLDIGTNGELALILNDRIIASSTAAGPCFEGMTISSGMRAGAGAIERVSLGEVLSFEVIGGSQASGICGSGLLDLVAELIRTRLVNQRGRLQAKDSPEVPDKYRRYLFEKEGKRHFLLHNEVSISQEDIRQVQLAKAAIRAGVELLLSECGIRAEDIKTAIIAGGFGYHLKKESIFGVGILPELKNAELYFVGNSSLGGAVKALINKNSISESEKIVRASSNIDLSQNPSFESTYVKEMHF